MGYSQSPDEASVEAEMKDGKMIITETNPVLAGYVVEKLDAFPKSNSGGERAAARRAKSEEEVSFKALREQVEAAFKKAMERVEAVQKQQQQQEPRSQNQNISDEM